MLLGAAEECRDPSLRLVFALIAQRTILAQDDKAKIRKPGGLGWPGRGTGEGGRRYTGPFPHSYMGELPELLGAAEGCRDPSLRLFFALVAQRTILTQDDKTKSRSFDCARRVAALSGGLRSG